MDNGTFQTDRASQRTESLTSLRWVLDISSHRVMGCSRPASCASCLPGWLGGRNVYLFHRPKARDPSQAIQVDAEPNLGHVEVIGLSTMAGTDRHAASLLQNISIHLGSSCGERWNRVVVMKVSPVMFQMRLPFSRLSQVDAKL